MSNDEDDAGEDTPVTPLPNQFFFSIYRENESGNTNGNEQEDNLKIISPYKCLLCRKYVDGPMLTCTICVNAGAFCPSNHRTCSHKRREFLLKLLNKDDYYEFLQYSNSKTYHLRCCDRMFLLTKFQSEKKTLQVEYETKLGESMKMHEMYEDIQTRKLRLNLMHDRIKIIRERIEQKKQRKIETSRRISAITERIQTIKVELTGVNNKMISVEGQLKSQIHVLTKQIQKLNKIRHEFFNDLSKYIFPIKDASASEDAQGTRIINPSQAQLSTNSDEMDDEQIEQKKRTVNQDCRLQIVNSYLVKNGDYQIHSLLLAADTERKNQAPGSAYTTEPHALYEVVSGLSHACQLVNVMAFCLQIHLPFRLHCAVFHTNDLTAEDLRANITKLDANIVSSCLSQGIPIEFDNVSHTLENLLQLLQLDKYPSRPRSVGLPQEYINTIKKQVDQISGASMNDYWSDEDDNDEANLSNDNEWEAISAGDFIPNDQSVSDYSDSTSSNSSQQHSTLMSSSIEFLRNKFLFR